MSLGKIKINLNILLKSLTRKNKVILDNYRVGIDIFLRKNQMNLWG